MIYLTLKKKLWLLTLVFLMTFIISGVMSSYFALKTASYLNPENVESLKEVIELSRHLKLIQNYLNSAAETGEEEFLQKILNTKDQFLSIIRSLKGHDPKYSPNYDRVKKLFKDYLQNGVPLSQLLATGNFSNTKIQAHANRVKSLLPLLKKEIEVLEDAKYQEFLDLQRAMEDISREHVRTDIIITLVAIIFALITAPLIIRSINRPLGELVRATRELGAGDLSARVKVYTKDEIGVLANSFNSTAEQLRVTQEKLSQTNEGLQEANRQLKEVDKHKTEFLSTMSHELRTPLNAIINFTDQIIEDWDELRVDDQWNLEAQDMLNRVLKSSWHLLSLINDLLDLAKIEAGMMKLDLEKNDIGLITAEAESSIQSLADAKGIRLEHTIQPPLPPVYCDERKITQVVLNLLSNAIKFTDTGGVRVNLFEEKNTHQGICLEVMDTGIGIPPDALHSIFDRFRQVDGSDSKRHQGTGLGLNLVKEIVEMHGGSVTIESEVGKGSCFRVFLPYHFQREA